LRLFCHTGRNKQLCSSFLYLANWFIFVKHKNSYIRITTCVSLQHFFKLYFGRLSSSPAHSDWTLNACEIVFVLIGSECKCYIILTDDTYVFLTMRKFIQKLLCWYPPTNILDNVTLVENFVQAFICHVLNELNEVFETLFRCSDRIKRAIWGVKEVTQLKTSLSLIFRIFYLIINTIFELLITTQ
jgi:hypothetical protein